MLTMVIFIVKIIMLMLEPKVSIIKIKTNKKFKIKSFFFVAKTEPSSNTDQENKSKKGDVQVKSLTENLSYPLIIATSHFDSSIRFWNEEVFFYLNNISVF
jgi:hypothetical protein